LSSLLEAAGLGPEENPNWDFMTLDFLALDHDVEVIEAPPTVVHKIDLNRADKNGATPLLAAVESGALANVELLLGTEGINPGAKDRLGRSALHTASMQGRADIVTLLTGAVGVEVNSRDRDGVSFV
jgi:ankyrin repeat protein